MSTRHYPAGFTLIELLVTLSVAVIILSIAAPNFSSFVNSNRITVTVNSLLGGLQLARSEAVTKHKKVFVIANDSNWSNGWKIFVDTNGNNQYDVTSNTDCSKTNTDCLLRSQAPINNVAIGFNNGGSISYSPTGSLSTGAGTFNICISGAIEKQIVINLSGSSRAKATGETCQ